MSLAPAGSAQHAGNGAQQNVPTTTPDLRNRVVEILSATANGCLTELGYFPGMPQRMIELERLNAKWQSENVKLFQDNQKFARLLQENERSKAIAGSDDQRTRVMHVLEEQVHVLKEEKKHLLKQAEVFRHDYIKLSNMYGAARSEIDHLRRHIQQHLHPTSCQVSSDQAGNVSMVHNGQNSQLYQIAQAQQSQRPIQVYYPNQAVSVAAPFNSLPPASIVPAIQRRASDPMVQASMDQQISINTTDQTHSHYIVHSQTPTSTSGNAYSRSSSRGSLQPLKVNTSMEHGQHLPTPMSGVNAPQQLPFSSSPGSQQYLPPIPPAGRFFENHASPQEQGPLYPSVISPLPNLLQTTAPIVGLEHRRTDDSASLSNQTAVNQVVSNGHATPTSSVASPPKSGHDVSKRTSVDMSGESDDIDTQQRKKPKLDSRENHMDRDEGQPAISGADADAIGISGNEDQDDDESDDGVIEIGPDGLRLEGDCIAALIEEVGENGDLMACKLCNARFDMGYEKVRPQPFVRPTQQELVEHCSTEHESAWKELRNSI